MQSDAELRARDALAQAYHLETGRPIVDNYWRQRSLGTMGENDRYAVRAMLSLADRIEVQEKALRPFAEAGDKAVISGRPPAEFVDANAYIAARTAIEGGKP